MNKELIERNNTSQDAYSIASINRWRKIPKIQRSKLMSALVSKRWQKTPHVERIAIGKRLTQARKTKQQSKKV